jgi:hypothetical protein
MSINQKTYFQNDLLVPIYFYFGLDEASLFAGSLSALPPFSTHFWKYARCSVALPAALPAAGFPG